MAQLKDKSFYTNKCTELGIEIPAGATIQVMKELIIKFEAENVDDAGTVEALKAKVKGLVDGYNQLITDEKMNELTKAQVGIAEQLKKLNEAEKKAQIHGWLAQENPLIACLDSPEKGGANGTYIFTAVKYDPALKTGSIAATAPLVDIMDIAKVRPGVFAQSTWAMKTDYLNAGLRDSSIVNMKIASERVGKKLASFGAGKVEKDEYKRELGVLLDELNFLQNGFGGVTIALQTVVDHIIEGFKVREEDAITLALNYSQWSGKNARETSLATESKFRKQLCNVLTAVVQNAGYTAV